MQDLKPLVRLCEETGAQIQTDVPMSEHTSFHIGGACRALVTLPDAAACQKIVRRLRTDRIPFRLIGRGTNLLVPDSGYRGVVLKLGGSLAGQPVVEGETITCGAGTSLKNLCLAALSASLTGLEFAYGIPGSVGGAVYMNAGAYDGEMQGVLTEVTFLNSDAELRTLSAAELGLGYRHSVFMEHDWLILSAKLTLQKGDSDAIRARMRELLGRRQEKQPLEYPSAGSTFKRPAGSYASKLIDECGLKGYRVGGAQVSTKHAGFVVNRGGATYADVMAVCKHVQETVQAKTGFVLELEPEILNV